MRFTRLLIGLVLVIVSIWVIVGEQMGGASANAMVNARLATLRAPIAGEVTMPDLALGATVRRSEELAAVSDSRVDRVRLNDLVLEQNDARIERDRLRDVITETRNVVTTISVRAARFERSNIRQAEIRLTHALERLELLEERAKAASSARVAVLDPLAGDRLTRLDAEPTSSAVPLPRGVTSDLALAIEWAREEVGVRRSALSAARDGIYVDNDYSDSTYAGQRLAELQARLDGYEAAYRAQISQISALDKRITEERIIINHLTEAPLVSMLDGRLWEVLAGHGERVERGQDVLRLLDCGNVIVTASVSESVYNRLKPGDAARFRLSGTGEVFDATVERLAGASAATIYRNLAVAPGPKHLERYDVAVSVPGLSSSEAGHCPVGRTGRVFFEGRPLDRLRGLL